MNTLVEGDELETWNVTRPSKETSKFYLVSELVIKLVN